MIIFDLSLVLFGFIIMVLRLFILYFLRLNIKLCGWVGVDLKVIRFLNICDIFWVGLLNVLGVLELICKWEEEIVSYCRFGCFLKLYYLWELWNFLCYYKWCERESERIFLFCIVIKYGFFYNMEKNLDVKWDYKLLVFGVRVGGGKDCRGRELFFFLICCYNYWLLIFWLII